MSLPPRVENRVHKAIEWRSFRLDFEDICYYLLRRLPKYRLIKRRKKDPDRPAISRGPDAYVVTKSGEMICIEPTARKKNTIKRHLKDKVSSAFYKNNAATIKEVAFCFAELLEEDDKKTYKELVEAELGCSCVILEKEDLVGRFRDNPDLVEPLLGIDYRPEVFRSLDLAVESLGRHTAFPKLERFLNGDLYQESQLEQILIDTILEGRGPCLLTGRWGTGKTVFALTVGFQLRDVHQLSAYYLDMEADCAGHWNRGVESAISEDLSSFHHPRVLFIIDNAHMFPKETYQFAYWAKKVSANVLFVARPVSKFWEGYNDNFFKLFTPCSAAEGEEMQTQQWAWFENVDGDEGVNEADSISDELADGTDQPIKHPRFTIRPTKKIVRWLFNRRLHNLNISYHLQDDELEKLAEGFGYNLTLITLLLPEWDPSRGDLTEVKRNKIYNVLRDKYNLENFPSVYLLATLNYFDCPADSNCLFTSPQEKKDFDNFFFEQEGAGAGLIIKRSGLMFNIDSAEALLICETGRFLKSPFLKNRAGLVPNSISGIFERLIVYYLLRKPRNPFEVLRRLCLAAFEAKMFESLKKEEEIRNILFSALTHEDILEFLSHLLAERPVMLRFANIAKLCRYVGSAQTCVVKSS